MKKLAWSLVIVGVAVAAAVSIVALPRGAEWTTNSPEALAAFEDGREAESKLYHRDAADLYARALELDPDFFAAKVQLAMYVTESDRERAEAMRQEALATDRARLTPREQLIFDRLQAYRTKDGRSPEEILDTYLAEYPDDPYAMAIKARNHFSRGELEQARLLYQRLVEVDPNFVIAYNQLGYTAMQEARFSEAEEHFTSYRFIAPDQANPHDSLGELFVILGRYQEAAQSFERAIEIKTDFWNSYVHLVIVRILMGQADEAERVVQRALDAKALDEPAAEALRCSLRCWRALESRDWQRLLTEHEQDPSCLENQMAFGPMISALHRAAAALGRFDQAKAYEAQVAEALEKHKSGVDSKESAAGLQHMRGVRLACQGDLDEAEVALREADGALVYKNADLGLFKLFNRLVLVEVLLARGNQAEAHSLLSQVKTVNPTLAEAFEADGLSWLDIQ